MSADDLLEAVERLGDYPHEVTGAAMLSMWPTAFNVIADASDDTLLEAFFLADSENVFKAYAALRFLARFVLTLRQAKRAK